jgi:hypothetical protein
MPRQRDGEAAARKGSEWLGRRSCNGTILENRNDRARLVAYSPRTLDHQAWPRRADARSVARAVGAEFKRGLERES